MKAALECFPQADTTLRLVTELNRICVELSERTIQVAREGRRSEQPRFFLLEDVSQRNVM